MVSHFFVNRPIFAWVISLIIMISGIASINMLTMEQYPDIAPPVVNIATTYKGASAQTVENSVTQIIEQQLTGLDGLLYFSSSSTSSGSARIKVTFKQGTDPDIAQVQVNNKVQQVLSRLPEDVQRQGVTVVKSQTDFLLLAAIYDSTDKDAGIDVADFLVSNLQDQISRIDGVGGIQVFGGQYAMRIWLDPTKLEAYNLMPSDIQAAIKAQNSQVSAGKIGDLPALSEQELNLTVIARDKFKTAEQFRNIVVKNNFDGSVVRLGDIARVELGNENYGVITRLNGHPSSGIAVQLASGSNAVVVANNVKALLAKFEGNLPDGYKIAYPRDTTEFIKASITEVVKTLFEAIFLVIIVMYVFLGSWRATIIPAIAVPVVLLGTFTILYIFGFSINTLTMFAMVLSIGLLVDDAIVVVESVERIMREENLSPKEATIASMQKITSALIGIATVLSVVFLPMAFFSGSTGVIYRQFSITIVSAMVLSVVVALTLTPALCAMYLRPHTTKKNKGLLDRFHTWFDKRQNGYKLKVAKILTMPIRWMIFYLAIIVCIAYFFIKLPTSFLPKEDQGGLMVQFTLPTGASSTRTVNVANKIKEYFMNEEKDNLNTIFTISGYRFSGGGQNGGMAFVSLKNWDLRTGAKNQADAIAQRATQTFNNKTSPYFMIDARVFSMNPPVIQGLGQTDGFELQIQADASTSRDKLMLVMDKIVEEARGTTAIVASIRADGSEETPQLRVIYDEEKAFAHGLSMSDIDNTLSVAWAGNYVNDFIDRARVKKVYLQGDMQFRSKPEDLNIWTVRNKKNQMTSFKEFANTKFEYGFETLSRYNGLASFEIQGSSAHGVSSGVAMDKMDEISEKNADGTIHSWSGLSYQERLSQGQAYYLYAISILIVFLCLAALYESWSIPFSVLMVIPLGVIGTVLAVTLRGLDNDVYFQVALLTTVGLSAKNAILIVEFVEDAFKRGKPLIAATIEGATLRLRPILMTSLAFIAGVLPLAISTGAGANSRISIGTGIVGGTLTATALTIFFVPLFFVLIKKAFNPIKT